MLNIDALLPSFHDELTKISGVISHGLMGSIPIVGPASVGAHVRDRQEVLDAQEGRGLGGSHGIMDGTLGSLGRAGLSAGASTLGGLIGYRHGGIPGAVAGAMAPGAAYGVYKGHKASKINEQIEKLREKNLAERLMQAQQLPNQ